MAQTWTKSDDTDIRRTWAAHWPKQTQDAVWERIKKQIDIGHELPKGPFIQTHKSPEQNHGKH